MNYKDIKTALISLLEGERNFIANAANFSSFLFNNIEGVNWCGFYFLNGDNLVLGPFAGKPACLRIPVGKGVCGSSAKNRRTLVVKDVHEFPGHIACDPDSKSEIVIPIIHEGVLYGVLDIDSPLTGRFSEEDRSALEELNDILIAVSDVKALSKYYS